MNTELHIPEGIRFECTGCGNCCLNWPVPLTSADVETLDIMLSNGQLHELSYKKLPQGHAQTRGFTHSLEKRTDGKCAYLTEQNRCELHEKHGIESKPSMCRLFPYSFTPTPSGVYAYVSFASSGVLCNSGKLLTEQRSELEQQWQQFQQLFPHVDSDWGQVQLIDGTPLPWSQYLNIESRLLETISDDTVDILSALAKCSELVTSMLPPGTNPERLPPLEASAKTIDQILLAELAALYWPTDVFSEAQFDFPARDVMTKFVRPPAVVTIFGGTRFKTFLDIKLGKLPDDVEALLRRFVYARIFGKLFFGRSYGHLSLLSGVNHLYYLVLLIRQKAKVALQANQEIDFWFVAELIRTLERRLTQMNLSKESCSVLETLLASPSRVERTKSLVL